MRAPESSRLRLIAVGVLSLAALGSVSQADDLDLVFLDGRGIHPEAGLEEAHNARLNAASALAVTVPQNPLCQVPTEFPNRPPVNGPVVWIEQEVATSFGPPFAIPFNFAQDFDLDGDVDLFSGHTQPNISEERDEWILRVWLNEGTGVFVDGTADVLEGPPASWSGPRGLHFLDANGDGLQDIYINQHGFDVGCGPFVCPGAPNVLFIRQPDGDLVDVAPTNLNPYDLNGFTHAGAVADVDCDGDVDLFEGQWPNGVATAPNHLQINDGSGVFMAEDNRLPASILPSAHPASVFCDLDRDGDPELVISHAPGRTRVLENDGFGNFQLLPENVLPVSSVGDAATVHTDIRCGDVDLDGFADLLLPLHDPPVTLELLLNNGNMTFSDVTATHLPQTFASEGGGIAGAALALIDLNNDGWLDILGTSAAAQLRIWWNTGRGSFSEWRFPDDTAIDLRGSWVTPGDFDGDGLNDLHIDRSTFEHFVLWNKGPALHFFIGPLPANR